MRVHYLQHVDFEDIGSMAEFFDKRNVTVSCTHLFSNETFPDIETFDLLIVMGGPMGIYDEMEYSWLKKEKKFIEKAIMKNKKVLGICLGAQLIADVLGAKVYKNKYKEIGWFDIKPTEKVKNTILKDVFAEPLKVLHWHGDTFNIPEDAVLIASSEACRNQGFVYDNRVIALQFHLETTYASLKQLVENAGDELDNSEYVQSKEEILNYGDNRYHFINDTMGNILYLMLGLTFP